MEAAGGIANLFDCIDMGKTECLNEDSSHPFANAFYQDSDAVFLKYFPPFSASSDNKRNSSVGQTAILSSS